MSEGPSGATNADADAPAGICNRPMARRLICAALIACLGQGVYAAPLAAQDKAAAPFAESGDVLMQADTLTYERAEKRIIAEGNVEIAYGERLLFADRVTYDQTSDTVVASGNVALMDPSGDVAFADKVALKNEMRDGLARSFSVLMTDDSRLAAPRAERIAGNRTVMERAVFSPCEICESGEREPLWQIKAYRVEHDKDEATITYRNAFLEFFGVPLLYTPYFSHPDPTVDRKSGFLTPSIGNSTELGAEASVPYYWSINPTMDLTLTPTLYSRENPLYQADFRQRIDNGQYNVAVTGTRPRQRPKDTPGDTSFRGSLFGRGQFFVGDSWTAGYRAELTTDDTFLRRYDLSDETDLVNRLYARRVTPNSTFAIDSFYFQGLLAEDDASTMPWILPQVDYKYRYPDQVLGGRMDLSMNALVLQTESAADSNRLSSEVNWERSFIHSSGQILRPFVQLRGDIYWTYNVEKPNPAAGRFGHEVVPRMLPTAGVEWSYPMMRPGENGFQVIEPIAQVIVSPDLDNSDEIPNEDSQNVEFDTTNLFAIDRFPGRDLWETGPRAAVGLRYRYVDNRGPEASVTFGQSYRLQDDDSFSEASGLRDKVSDYVGRIGLEPSRNLALTYRFRLDNKDFSFARNEVNATTGIGPIRASLGYAFYAPEQSEDLTRREEVSVGLNYRINEYWRAFGGFRRDLELKTGINNRFGIAYQDECFGMALSYSQSYLRDRDVEPSTTILLQLTLKHLGTTSFGTSADYGTD